jgi:hypothetical protein
MSKASQTAQAPRSASTRITTTLENRPICAGIAVRSWRAWRRAKTRRSGSKNGSGRWSQWDEIAWSHSDEITWVQSHEILHSDAIVEIIGSRSPSKLCLQHQADLRARRCQSFFDCARSIFFNRRSNDGSSQDVFHAMQFRAPRFYLPTRQCSISLRMLLYHDPISIDDYKCKLAISSDWIYVQSNDAAGSFCLQNACNQRTVIGISGIYVSPCLSVANDLVGC